MCMFKMIGLCDNTVTVYNPMSETNREFENLKKNIINKYKDSLDLNKAKAYFSHIIDSRRSLSRVKSLDDIFFLLQRRDALGWNNVSALEQLQNITRNEEVKNLVLGYKKLFTDSKPVCDCCGEDLVFSFPVLNPKTDDSENNESESLDLALDNVAMNIGAKWHALASELNVPECYVDLVREKYPMDMYQQALNILKIWKAYQGKAATLNVLQKALESRLCKMSGIGDHMLKPVIILE